MGGNSTGKTILLKTLYAACKSIKTTQESKIEVNKEEFERILTDKLIGVFHPDDSSIGRLVLRKQGSNRAECSINFSPSGFLDIGIGNRQTKHIDLNYDITQLLDSPIGDVVFIPPKEAISTTENFGTLYEKYHIAFEETYYDLCRLLEQPLRKGSRLQEQNSVLEKFENLIDITMKETELAACVFTGKVYMAVRIVRKSAGFISIRFRNI